MTGDSTKVLNNILIVRPQSEKDFGTYTCNVTNIAGSTVHQIRLEEQKQSSGGKGFESASEPKLDQCSLV